MAKITPQNQPAFKNNPTTSKPSSNKPAKAPFSPTLRAKKTDIMMWCDQGKNEDQLLANLPGVSREELRNFMKANNLTIKQIHSRKRV